MAKATVNFAAMVAELRLKIGADGVPYFILPHVGGYWVISKRGSNWRVESGNGKIKGRQLELLQGLKAATVEEIVESIGIGSKQVI